MHRGDGWRQVGKILAEMRERSIRKDIVTYGASIFASARGTQWESALCTFEEMKWLGGKVRPREDTYTQVILACNLEGNWARALSIWLGGKVRPREDTYTQVILA